MNKIERMNHIRYKLCNDEIEYMDMLDEFVDLAMAVLNDDKQRLKMICKHCDKVDMNRVWLFCPMCGGSIYKRVNEL